MIIIIILIVINSYIIIKDNDNDNDDGNNAQNKDNKKYLKEIKKESSCEWSFLTITITITTNKTLITGKTLTGEEKKTTIILIYYIQTMKRLPCLMCSVNITFIKTKRDICL